MKINNTKYTEGLNNVINKWACWPIKNTELKILCWTINNLQQKCKDGNHIKQLWFLTIIELKFINKNKP